MSTEKIEELFDQAYDMAHTPAKVALLEEAARLADSQHDEYWSFAARMEIVEAGAFGGMHDKALVAFSWCLAAYDKQPEEYDEESIMWRYKWILDHMPAYPQVSKSQIVGMQDDMTLRLLQLDCSPRPAEYFRWSNLMRMGELKQAEESHARWQELPDDWLSDCTACEAEKTAELMIRLGRDEKAMEAAEPIVQRKIGCAEIPHRTYCTILRPLMRMGKLEEASVFEAKGYRMIARNPEFLGSIAEQFIFLARTRSFRKGLPRMEKHLPWAISTTDIDARMHFYDGCALLLEALVAHSGNEQRKLRLPKELPCYREEEPYHLPELAAWFRSEAEGYAEQFNDRNGNDYCTQWMQENRELAEIDSA